MASDAGLPAAGCLRQPVCGDRVTDPWEAVLLSLPVPLDVLVLGLALLVDLVWGEPPVRIHPTVLIGRTIGAAERRAPAADAAPAAQLAYGALMAAAIPGRLGCAGLGGERRLARVAPAALLGGGGGAAEDHFLGSHAGARGGA